MKPVDTMSPPEIREALQAALVNGDFTDLATACGGDYLATSNFQRVLGAASPMLRGEMGEDTAREATPFTIHTKPAPQEDEDPIE